MICVLLCFSVGWIDSYVLFLLEGVSLSSLYTTLLCLSLPVLSWSLLCLSMATPAFFCLPLAWSIVFYPFTLSLSLSLELRCVSWRQDVVVSCFLIHQHTLCLLIGEFNSFTFRMIIDIWWLNTAILSPVSWLFYISIVSLPLYFGLPFILVVFCGVFFIFYILWLCSDFFLYWLLWGLYKRSHRWNRPFSDSLLSPLA